MSIQKSIFAGWRKSVASFGLAVARMAGYDAARITIEKKQASRYNTNPNSTGAQVERLLLQWNAEDALKNIPLAAAYINTRRAYCSPQGWQPDTGDAALNRDVRDYCEEEWKTMGVNCSMWTAFSRTFDVEQPLRGDAGMYWFRDMFGKLKLIEFSADQIGELYTFVNPVTKVNGMNYFAGIFSDPRMGGENVAYKIYDRGYQQIYFNPQNIPASDVLYGQDNMLRGNRGITVFAQALVTMGKTENLWQATIDAAQLQSKRGVVIKNALGSPYDELSYDTQINEDNSVTYIERNMDGAQAEYLYNGDSYEVTKTEQPSEAVIQGARWGAKMACLSLGFPYSFIVDPETVGGAPVRLDIGKAAKEITRITRLSEIQFGKIAFVTIMNGINNGVFRGAALRNSILSGHVQFPTGPTVDAFRDTKDDIMSIRSGLDSPQRVTGRYRENYLELLDEKKEFAIEVAKRIEDANKELVADGYKPVVTSLDIAQNTDNPIPAQSTDQEKKPKSKAQAQMKYDPEEPRDENGEWTSGGSSRVNKYLNRIEEGNGSINLWHGTGQSSPAIHAGQTFADNRETADRYSKGKTINGDLDLTGLKIGHSEKFDRDDANHGALGDKEEDIKELRKRGVDVIKYSDEDPHGKEHTAYRLISDKAVNRLKDSHNVIPRLSEKSRKEFQNEWDLSDDEIYDLEKNGKSSEQWDERMEEFSDSDEVKELKSLHENKQASMSAYIGDVSVSDLPDDTQKAIESALGTNGSTGKFKVAKYGMTAAELLRKADSHNLESAKNTIRYNTCQSCAEEVHGNEDKHVLIMNDRVIDGHHFLAKALKGKVTKSLPVIDLTPARFQNV